MTSQPPLRLPARKCDAHKGNFGRILLVGGSRGMSGSIAMSAVAALKTGSGLVTAAVPDRCLESVAACHPCLMTQALPDDGEGRFSTQAADTLVPSLGGVSAVGCGPGMTTGPGAIEMVRSLLNATRVPRVIDADAINVLAKIAWSEGQQEAGPMVLTPHPGELERISGASSGDRRRQITAARALADRFGVVIVVKGGPTVVAGREEVWTNSTGNPGMATAGSGDVLTGVITSLLGQGLSVWQAACLGVWLHGHAGDRAAERCGQAGMTALEILQALPEAAESVVER